MANVSVIIPLYNKENYIARAIKSVIGQTYQDYELIVVDDGSTDNGPDLVRTFRDPRLKLVKQHNLGPGAARNRGIKESTAPYLAFLDADDEWMPEFLERYLEAIVENPECGYVVGPWVHFECEDRTDKSFEWHSLNVFEGVWSLPSNVTCVELNQLLYKLNCVGAMLCTRDVIERYDGFYSKNACRYGEDRYLQIQLLLNHRVFRLVEPLVWIHSEPNGISALLSFPRPLPPTLSDPDPVRLSCPTPFQPVLEEWLASNALVYALEYQRAGDLSVSRSLIRRFPAMKKYKRKFVRLCCLHIASVLRGIASIGRSR